MSRPAFPLAAESGARSVTVVRMTGPEPEDNCQRIGDLEEGNQSLREELTRFQTENDRLYEFDANSASI